MLTVLLKDGTVGQTEFGTIGQKVTVTLHDENGMPIEVTGQIVEILVGEELRGIEMTAKFINDKGLQEIHAFLADNHRLGGAHFTASMLRAWAADAEFSLSEGNDAGIEIRSFDSVHGRTQTFTVSDAGIDTEFVKIDE